MYNEECESVDRDNLVVIDGRIPLELGDAKGTSKTAGALQGKSVGLLPPRMIVLRGRKPIQPSCGLNVRK